MAQSYTKQINASNEVYTLEDAVNKRHCVPKQESLRIASLFSLLRDQYDESYLLERSTRMSECGSWLKYKNPVVDGELDFKHGRVFQADFCRDRMCPQCQQIKSYHNRVNLAKCMRVLADCGMRFVWLTLTIPNVSSDKFGDALSCLNKGWSRFYHIKRVQAAFKGYFKVIETTYNHKSNTYHPHMHVLIVVEKSYFEHIDRPNSLYLRRDDIGTLWTRCNKSLLDEYNLTHDNDIYFFSVNVKSVKMDAVNLEKSVFELSKYCFKSSDIDETTFPVLEPVLHGSRSYEYMGAFRYVFRALKLDDDKMTDEEDLPDVEYVLTQWTYSPEIKRYIMKTT